MKNIFKPGDQKSYSKIVGKDETASFEDGEVHPFYGTFALGRDVEWAGRLFVLDMKESHEEGIGTYLHIDHHSPALVGEMVVITAEIEAINGRKMDTLFKVEVGSRLIASGKTGQMILDKKKIEQIKAELNG
jgi:fluoroacetyl-CoA thioesterase